jgi:hypothetical protein
MKHDDFSCMLLSSWIPSVASLLLDSPTVAKVGVAVAEDMACIIGTHCCRCRRAALGGNTNCTA